MQTLITDIYLRSTIIAMKLLDTAHVRIIAGTILILLIPLVTMQFTDEVQWSLSDFIIAGVIIAGTGFGVDLLSRSSRSSTQKLLIGILLASAFLLLWIELAVGLFGTPFSGN